MKIPVMIEKTKFKGVTMIIALLMYCSALSAQKYTLSPQNIDDPGFEYVKVIGQDDGGFYLLQSNLTLNSQRDRIGFRNRKYKISYYDFNLNQHWNKRLEDDADNYNIDVVTMFNGHPL
ncbi:MAG: hypothetical protein ABI772_10935, partial [Bacteroidota bacterium]